MKNLETPKLVVITIAIVLVVAGLIDAVVSDRERQHELNLTCMRSSTCAFYHTQE